MTRSLHMQEAFTTSTNTCGQWQPAAADFTTGSDARFQDNFFLCDINTCSLGGQCSIVRSQSWTADGHNVGQYTLDYQCTAFTITP